MINDSIECLNNIENFLDEYANMYFRLNSKSKYKDDINITIKLDYVYDCEVESTIKLKFDTDDIFVIMYIQYHNPYVDNLSYIVPIFKSDIKSSISLKNTYFIMLVIFYLQNNICSYEQIRIDNILEEYYDRKNTTNNND